MTGLRAKMQNIGHAFAVLGYIYKWARKYHYHSEEISVDSAGRTIAFHRKFLRGYDRFMPGYDQNCPVCLFAKEFKK